MGREIMELRFLYSQGHEVCNLSRPRSVDAAMAMVEPSNDQFHASLLCFVPRLWSTRRWECSDATMCPRNTAKWPPKTRELVDIGDCCPLQTNNTLHLGLRGSKLEDCLSRFHPWYMAMVHWTGRVL